MKIVITDTAKGDLKGIERYLLRHNAMAAVRVVDTILTSIDILAEYPLIGRSYQGEVRRLNITRYPYTVFYRVFETRQIVEIDTILHGQQEPPTF